MFKEENLPVIFDVETCESDECLGRYNIAIAIAYTTIGDEIDYDNCLVKEMEEKLAPSISSDCIWSQDCDISDCESYSGEYDLEDMEELEECLEDLRDFAADIHETILDEIDNYLIEKARSLFPEKITFHGHMYKLDVSHETAYDLPVGELYLVVCSDSEEDLEYLKEHLHEFLEKIGWPSVVEEQCFLTTKLDSFLGW